MIGIICLDDDDNLQNIKKQYCWFCAVLFIVADKVGMSAKPGGIGTWGSKKFPTKCCLC